MKRAPIYHALQALFALVLILSCVMACGPRAPASDEPTLPGYTMETLDEYRGRVVVVNFWATWCLPCRAEMPSLQAAYHKYQDQGVVVLGVNVGDSTAEILDYAEQKGLTFPLLIDPRRQVARESGVRVLPTTLFVDRQGEERHRHLGSLTESILAEQIEAMLE